MLILAQRTVNLNPSALVLCVGLLASGVATAQEHGRLVPFSYFSAERQRTVPTSTPFGDIPRLHRQLQERLRIRLEADMRIPSTSVSTIENWGGTGQDVMIASGVLRRSDNRNLSCFISTRSQSIVWNRALQESPVNNSFLQSDGTLVLPAGEELQLVEADGILPNFHRSSFTLQLATDGTSERSILAQAVGSLFVACVPYHQASMDPQAYEVPPSTFIERTDFLSITLGMLSETLGVQFIEHFRVFVDLTR